MAINSKIGGKGSMLLGATSDRWHWSPALVAMDSGRMTSANEPLSGQLPGGSSDAAVKDPEPGAHRDAAVTLAYRQGQRMKRRRAP